MIRIIGGWWANGACRTIVRCCQFDLNIDINLPIFTMMLMFANTSQSMVMADTILYFTQREVLNLIYHLFSFTTNSKEHQLTTSQLFQPILMHNEALVAAASHCALS
jgi:hypothetical protein